MNLSIADGKKLLVNLVGTMKGIAWENEGAGFTKSLQLSFRPLITTAVKSDVYKRQDKEYSGIVSLNSFSEHFRIYA